MWVPVIPTPEDGHWFSYLSLLNGGLKTGGVWILSLNIGGLHVEYFYINRMIIQITVCFFVLSYNSINLLSQKKMTTTSQTHTFLCVCVIH